MVEDRSPHQVYRLLSRVVVLLLIGAAHDELRGRGRPDRAILTGLPEPRSVLLPDVPAGLVLIPVVGPRQDRSSLVPDDLLRVKKPDPDEPVEDLPGEHRGVPDVRDLETWHELECRGPVRAGVSRDLCLVVALRPLLHVA